MCDSVERSFTRSELRDRTARKPDDVQRIWVGSQELGGRVVGRCWPYQRKGTGRDKLHIELVAVKKSVSDILKKTATYWLCERS